MADGRGFKEQLPYPYNQDLSQVLRRLNRRTVFGRERLANDAATAGYIAAAVRLIERRMGCVPEDPWAGDIVDGESIERPLLSFLSQRSVAAEAAVNPAPFPPGGSVPTMRTTWKSQSDFIADVLSFVLCTGYYPREYSDLVASGAERLVTGTDFVEAVQDLAYGVSESLRRMASFRLQLVAAATAEGDEVVRRALAEKYHRGRTMWMQVYAEFISARGLRLRRGITIEQFTDILTAMVEGVIVRDLADPAAAAIDEKHGRSLLGTAALALMGGALELEGESDGLSLEQSVDALVYRRPRPPDRGGSSDTDTDTEGTVDSDYPADPAGPGAAVGVDRPGGPR